MIHIVKGFGVINKAEIDVLLEFSFLFYDPVYVGNLITGYSALSKSSLNIWKFLLHILLKPSLKDFEHSLTRIWNESNCMLIWTFFGIAFGIGMQLTLFQCCDHCWVFQICWHNECSTFTASSFRVWNNSAGIPTPPLALFVVMLPKARLTSDPRLSGSGEWPHNCGCLGH